MGQVIWSQPAIDSLDEIADYIALDDFQAAKRLVDQVLNSVKKLQKFPQSGRIIPEIDELSYRELIVGPCRIFYRVEKDRVYIMYVMRSERKLRQFMLEDQIHEGQSQYRTE